MSSNKNFKEMAVSLVRKQLFIPIAALIILVLFNLIADPSFFRIIVIKSALPANTSSTELSKISHTRWCKP